MSRLSLKIQSFEFITLHSTNNQSIHFSPLFLILITRAPVLWIEQDTREYHLPLPHEASATPTSSSHEILYIEPPKYLLSGPIPSHSPITTLNVTIEVVSLYLIAPCYNPFSTLQKG